MDLSGYSGTFITSIMFGMMTVSASITGAAILAIGTGIYNFMKKPETAQEQKTNLSFYYIFVLAVLLYYGRKLK